MLYSHHRRPAAAFFTVAVAAAVFISCQSEPTNPLPVVAASAGAASESHDAATVRFGLVDVGTGIPAPLGHDASTHANRTMVPGTVVIDKGGSVTFEIVNPHQISIYGGGKRPEDVNASIRAAMPAGCPNPDGIGRITDPDRLVASWSQACNAPRLPITYQFNEAGRFLVICSFNPHFQVGMYGWVIVRDR